MPRENVKRVDNSVGGPVGGHVGGQMAALDHGPHNSARSEADDSLQRRSNEHLLKLLLSHLPIITYVCEAGGDFGALHCAGLAEQITGYPPEAFITNRSLWIDRLHPEDKPRILRELDALFANGQHVQEYRWQRKDGRYIWLTDLLRLVRRADGTPEYIVGAWYDITERKRAEQELAQYREELEGLVQQRTVELMAANERLRAEMAERVRIEAEAARAQKLESLGVLAGGIAHDFNNILTGVVGSVSVVKSKFSPGTRIHHRLDIAEKACTQAKALTDQLLTFSRGGKPLRRPTDILSLVKNTTQLVLSGSSLSLELDCEPSLWCANIDEGQIAQVISNLVINSKDAAPRDGKVRILLRNREIGAGEHADIGGGRYLQLIVQDSGTGIKSELLDRVCDPYFTTKQTGHGLGLAMVYSIVRQHEGRVEIRSTEGKGTTVSVLLPASDEDADRREQSVVPAAPMLGKRILIVDDEPLVLETAECIFADMGYATKCAGDGEEALHIYAAAMEEGRRFDAVVLDLTIRGGLGGKETIGRLRKIDPQATVLVSSGYSHDPIMADFHSFGFDGMIAKPYNLEAVAAAMSAVFAQRSEDND